jgi:predicted nucleic acid-binding protein
MIVIDASAMIELLVLGKFAKEITQFLLEGNQVICAPDLLRAEVLQTLRKLETKSNAARIQEALQDFVSMPIEYYSHEPLIKRVWQLRKNFTSYEAIYIALTEGLGGTLLTSDRAMASSRVHRAKVKYF